MNWKISAVGWHLSEMENYITRLARSVGFLSRIPVPARYFEGDDGNLSHTSGMFALAGAVIAFPVAFTAAILMLLDANSMLLAALMISAQIFINGALHEDGLSDCADGFWGGRDKSRILEIMRDSVLGTYGTIALLSSILIKFAALSVAMFHLSAVQLFILYIGVSALSRAAMVWHWHSLPPAREDGVAKQVGQPTNAAFNENLATAAIFIILMLISGLGTFNLALAILFATASVYYLARLSEKKIDGHTGDTIGASQQVCELGLLVGFAILI